jgi:bacteriorhodopsin
MTNKAGQLWQKGKGRQMTIYLLSSGITALACVVFLILAGRQSKDYISRSAYYLYAGVLMFAALSYLATFLQISTPTIQAAARSLTPIGWGALAIFLSRGLARGR